MAKNLLASIAVTGALCAQAAVVNVGSGSYTDQFPGTDQAGRNGYPTGEPQVSGNAANRPIPTNDWWSSELVKNHGDNIFNYPLALKPVDTGLVIISNFLQEGITAENPLTIGLTDTSASQTTVCDHSDWGVTLSWGNMEATILQGSPMVYFTRSGNADVRITASSGSVSANGNTLMVTGSFNGASYAIYAPAGSTWNVSGNTATSDLAGKSYWSAVTFTRGMDAAAMAAAYKPHAFVFPADTRADFSYDETRGKVTATYTVTTDVKEGDTDTPVMGLLPHHWAHLASQPQWIAGEYATVRGKLKMAATKSFSTELDFNGVLPTVPPVQSSESGYSQGELNRLTAAVIADSGFQDWTDSYNDGQLLNRMVQTARVAHESGDTEGFQAAFNLVKKQVERWLSYTQGDVAFLFYYHAPWTTMLGYPAGHGQDTTINDHHFHWGYLIHAAAMIEQYEPGWAAKWGGMIDLLIRDAASADRDDPMFPYLRNFSPYAGHSWANGLATIGLGVDQESTSESMQFNCSLIHWGEITGNRAIRDLGIALYAIEQSAIEEYWFDVHSRNFPSTYTSAVVSRVFSNGFDNQNFWGGGIAGSYGIQIYPVHAGSAYLVNDRGFATKYWNAMKAETGILSNDDNPNIWYDTWIQFLSMINPAQGLELYNSCTHLGEKFGVSQAQTYQWVHAHAALGIPVRTLTADSPLAMAYVKGDEITYVAQNYGKTDKTVKFSNGKTLAVPAGKMAWKKAKGTVPDPQPDPDEPINPDPTPGPDDPVNPDPGTSGGCNQVYTYTPGDDSGFKGDYVVNYSTNGTDVVIKAKFSGEYEGFAGPWLWNETDGFQEIQMSDAGDGWYSVTLQGIAAGTSLSIRIKIAFARGMAVTTSHTYIAGQSCDAEGIDTPSATEARIAITPNPADTWAKITVDGCGTLTIYDLSGVRRLSIPVDTEATIDLSSWQRGAYIVRFTAADGRSATARLLH